MLTSKAQDCNGTSVPFFSKVACLIIVASVTYSHITAYTCIWRLRCL